MTPNHLDSVRETLLALYDREQRIRIEYPGHSKETLPHVVRFVRTMETGRGFIPIPGWMGAHPPMWYATQVDYFRALRIPFEWMVCEHDSAPGLKEALLDNGFKPDLDPGDPGAVLVLDLKSVPPSLAAPKAQDVRRITRPEGLADVRHVMQQVWGDSFDWLQPRLGAHLAIPGYLSVYASYEQDEAGLRRLDLLPTGQSDRQPVWRVHGCEIPAAWALHRLAGSPRTGSRAPRAALPVNPRRIGKPPDGREKRLSGADLCLLV